VWRDPEDTINFSVEDVPADMVEDVEEWRD
jgi:hypothetical protein